MREQIRFTFDGDKLPGGAEATLEQLGIYLAEENGATFAGQRHLTVTLEATDPRLAALRQIVARHDAYNHDFRKDIYTDEEFGHARLLLMLPDEQCVIFGGMEWGTTYDFSDACPACSTGGRQTSAMFVDGKKLAAFEGHRAGRTIFDEVLVDAGLAADLVNAGVTGMVSHDVYAAMPDKRQKKLPWKQITAARALPPMSPRTTGIDYGVNFCYGRDLCEVCHRSGYNFGIDSTPRIVYREADVREADDVNASWEYEHFTSLQEGIMPHPFIFVTPKVRRVFLAAGVTSFDWLPIRVEETAGR